MLVYHVPPFNVVIKTCPSWLPKKLIFSQSVKNWLFSQNQICEIVQLKAVIDALTYADYVLY